MTCRMKAENSNSHSLSCSVPIGLSRLFQFSAHQSNLGLGPPVLKDLLRIGSWNIVGWNPDGKCEMWGFVRRIPPKTTRVKAVNHPEWLTWEVEMGNKSCAMWQLKCHTDNLILEESIRIQFHQLSEASCTCTLSPNTHPHPSTTGSPDVKPSIRSSVGRNNTTPSKSPSTLGSASTMTLDLGSSQTNRIAGRSWWILKISWFVDPIIIHM